MTYQVDLTNRDGDILHPHIKTSAIEDANDKLILANGTINNVNTLLTVKGKNVLTEGQGMEIKTIPNNDIYAINQTGVYHYSGGVKHKPLMNSNFANGFLMAEFTDDNTGMVMFFGSNVYLEKFQGKWRAPQSPTPVTLWSGNAKVGDTVKLQESFANYNELRFHVLTSLGNDYVRQSGEHNEFYLTKVGQAQGGNNLRSAEIKTVANDNKTSMQIAQALMNTAPGFVENITTPVLSKIEGLRY